MTTSPVDVVRPASEIDAETQSTTDGTAADDLTGEDMPTTDSARSTERRTITPVVLALSGAKPGLRSELSSGVTSVGRHSTSDLLVREVIVSRHHAEFRRVGDSVTVTDLGSLNGTFVNRQPISGTTTLSHGDEVRIGETRFLYLTH